MNPYLCFILLLQFFSNELTALSSNDIRYKFFDDKLNLTDEKDLQFHNNRSLIVYVHGFRSSINGKALVNFGRSLAESANSSNTAMVDWSEWTMKLDYSDAVAQLPAVASYLVDWLRDLRGRGIIDSYEDVTLVGHSLGAQLIGYTGRRLNGTVKRIVALDPAQPNFQKNKNHERIGVNSAQFVMVLHTSTMYLGLRDAVGHVDFYFNGGKIQPSCSYDTFCGHMIVLYYLTDSLRNSSTFTASRCCTINDCEKKIVGCSNKTIYMSMNLPTTTRGLYFVVPEKKKLKIYSQLFL